MLLVELTFCLLSSLWAGKEEYVFDLDRPENNANSIFAVRGKDVVVDDISVMDTITIYKPIFDPRDRAKVEVSLLSDGSGIEMKEPTVPTFFFTQVEDMYELDSDEERCASTILAHSVAATAIKNQVHRQSKRVVIEFPDGITCNKDFFNEAGDGLKLKKRFAPNARSGTLQGCSREPCDYSSHVHVLESGRRWRRKEIGSGQEQTG